MDQFEVGSWHHALVPPGPENTDAGNQKKKRKENGANMSQTHVFYIQYDITAHMSSCVLKSGFTCCLTPLEPVFLLAKDVAILPFKS